MLIIALKWYSNIAQKTSSNRYFLLLFWY